MIFFYLLWHWIYRIFDFFVIWWYNLSILKQVSMHKKEDVTMLEGLVLLLVILAILSPYMKKPLANRIDSGSRIACKRGWNSIKKIFWSPNSIWSHWIERKWVVNICTIVFWVIVTAVVLSWIAITPKTKPDASILASGFGFIFFQQLI